MKRKRSRQSEISGLVTLARVRSRLLASRLSRDSVRVKLAVKLTTRSQDACDLRLLVGKSLRSSVTAVKAILLKLMLPAGCIGRQRVPKCR